MNTAWPDSHNPIIVIFRENFDTGDKWGSTINYLFALCDVATKYSVEIPEELEFSISPFGPDEDADSFKEIEGLMSEDMYIHAPLTLEGFQLAVSHALKVLAKYDALLRLAGENY